MLSGGTQGEHRHGTDQGAGRKNQERVVPTDQVGENRDELDGDNRQQEADAGLRGQSGADKTGVRRLAQRRGEDARVGDDGSTPHQDKGDENDCRGCEEEW